MNDIERANELAEEMGLEIYTTWDGAVRYNGKMYYFGLQAKEFIDAVERDDE